MLALLITRGSRLSLSGRHRRGLTALATMALSSCAMSGVRDGQSALPMEAGDRLMLAAVQVPSADTAISSALHLALQSALRQSAHVRFLSPASITDALRRMQRDTTPSPLVPDSTAAEVAEREGARYVVSLSVSAASPARGLTLVVTEPSTRLALRSYRAMVAPEDLLSGIDALAARLRRDLGDTPAEMSASIPLPRATTPSLEALRLFAAANATFNRARYREARPLYEAALALDSGFVAARAGLANLEYVLNDIAGGDAQIARALAQAGRLPPRERLLLEAAAARGAEDWPRAASLRRAYLIRYPDDYDQYALLGYDLMRARQLIEALVAFDSLRAHRTLRAVDHINIAQLAMGLGRFPTARAAHVAALTLDPAFQTRVLQNEQIGKVLLAMGFADSARVVHNAMLARETTDQARGHRSLAYVDLYEGRYASAMGHLTQSIALYVPERNNALSEVRDRALLAHALADVGQATAAIEQLRQAATLCITRPLPPQALLWTGKQLARLGDTAMVRQLLDTARVRTRASDAVQQAATLALEAEWQIATGRAGAAVQTAAAALGRLDVANLRETRAFALERAGRLQDASAAYVALADDLGEALESEGQQYARLAPLAQARVEALLGRASEARRLVGQFMERWPSADQNLPFVTQLRARIVQLSP